MRKLKPAITIICCLSIFLKPGKNLAQSFDDYNPQNINTTLSGALLNKDSVQGLLLYYQGLKELPGYIVQFKKLEWIELSGNKMENVPEIIGKLNGLKFLNLSNNNISGLPSSIANLQQLEGLVLSNNNLANIPKEIYKLKKLKLLDLKGNNIKPEEINQLIELLPNCEINYY